MPRFLVILLVFYIVDSLKVDLITCFNLLTLPCTGVYKHPCCIELIGGPRATAGHRQYSSILEKFYQWPLFYSQHSRSAFLVSIRVSICYVRHQADIKEDHTIARPVCLLKRARVEALSEGNMVEATDVRKVQPFRVYAE